MVIAFLPLALLVVFLVFLFFVFAYMFTYPILVIVVAAIIATIIRFGILAPQVLGKVWAKGMGEGFIEKCKEAGSSKEKMITAIGLDFTTCLLFTWICFVLFDWNGFGSLFLLLFALVIKAGSHLFTFGAKTPQTFAIEVGRDAIIVLCAAVALFFING